jgi:sec-independent protein translocase protein TatB
MEAGLVLVITLVLVGPQRFPEIARQGGKWYRIARRFTADVTKDLRLAVDEIEQEIKIETDDLQSLRELGNLDAELKAAGDDVQSATESIAQAAHESPEKVNPAPSAPATAATAAAATTPPTSDDLDSTAEADSTAVTDSEGEPEPPEEASESEAETESEPDTTDPFKALEARQAAERDSRSGDRNGSGGTAD